MTASPHSSPGPLSEDELDRLLREYYATKLPREFPPLPLDTSSVVPLRAARSTPLSRGRLTLAACVVAVLLGFGYLLSIATPAGQRPVGFGETDNATGGNKNKPHDTKLARPK